MHKLKAFPIANGGRKANCHFLQNVFKWSSVSCTHLSPYTYTACAVWSGIGHEELKFARNPSVNVLRHAYVLIFLKFSFCFIKSLKYCPLQRVPNGQNKMSMRFMRPMSQQKNQIPSKLIINFVRKLIMNKWAWWSVNRSKPSSVDSLSSSDWFSPE